LFGKVEGKDCMYLTYALCFEAVWGNECIMSDILNLVLGGKLWPHYHQGKRHKYALEMEYSANFVSYLQGTF